MELSLNYANEASFKAYIDYLALKKHFTTKNYDYHKYRGKVKASFQAFQTRKDVFFFYKLSKKDDPHKILLANIVTNPKSWIRDIVEESGEENYISWEKRVQSLTYLFKTELNALNEDYKSNFVVANGQHPRLMTLYLQKKISLETITILASISRVLEYWETEVVDKIVAGDIITLIRKYYPFLQVDEKKFSQIVKERFF
jgi:hypothetical protein